MTNEELLVDHAIVEYRHTQLSQFQVRYEDWILLDEPRLVVANGYDGLTDFYVYTVADQLSSWYCLNKQPLQTIHIDSNQLPEGPVEPLVYELFSHSIPVQVTIERQPRVTGRFKGVDRLKLVFTR